MRKRSRQATPSRFAFQQSAIGRDAYGDHADGVANAGDFSLAAVSRLNQYRRAVLASSYFPAAGI
jgi:hypothetical protein